MERLATYLQDYDTNYSKLKASWAYIINQGFKSKASFGELSIYDGRYETGKYVTEIGDNGYLYCHKAFTLLDKTLIGQFFSKDFPGVMFAFFVTIETDGMLVCNLLTNKYIPNVKIWVTLKNRSQAKFAFSSLKKRVRQMDYCACIGVKVVDTLPWLVKEVHLSLT